MKKTVLNIGASVRSRLLTIARQSGRDYNHVLIRYAQERFLYRLSMSDVRENLILKGAMLFLPYNIPQHRPTKDVDFLGQGIHNEPTAIKEVLKRLLAHDANDGVVFVQNSGTAEGITEGAEYSRVRAHVECSVGGAMLRLQIDIGFGDNIVKGPIEIDYPVLLDFPAPRVNVYSLESAIAEKFEAIVRLNVVTSRMKDFYDIVYLAHYHTFSAENLAEAMHVTFTTRETPLADRAIIFADEFKNEKARHTQWQAFHRTNKLSMEQEFNAAIAIIQEFIEPVVGKPSRAATWNPDTLKWS